MAKYSKGAKKGVESSMKRMEKGTLRSGGSGKKVTDRKQAIAIGLSEAREKGAKVPAKKSASKKSAPKKSVAKKSAPKKSAPKKSAAKKSAPKKSAVKKSAPKKSGAKKSAPKKTAPGKSGPKKSAPKKSAVKKSAPGKSASKKSAPKKSAGGTIHSTIESREDFISNNAEREPENTSTEGRVEENNTTGDGQPATQDEPEVPVEENTAVPAKVEDPLTSVDQKAQQKALTKKDPRHNMPVSSNSKGFNRPSGKKPLWNK